MDKQKIGILVGALVAIVVVITLAVNFSGDADHFKTSAEMFAR